MTKYTFQVVVEPDGKCYVVKSIDEKHKNHGVQDTEMSNQAKIYEDPGK